MIKRLMLFTFLFGGNILNANTEPGIYAFGKQIGQIFGQTAGSFAKATGTTISLQYFFNFVLGKSSASFATILIKSFEKILLKTIRGTSITSYATAYNETIQEIAKKVFEAYNPGSTGTLVYSKPFSEFLAYSRELNSKNHHLIIRALITHLKTVYKNVKEGIFNLYNNLIKNLQYIMQNQKNTENEINGNLLTQEDDVSIQLINDFTFSVLMLYIDNVIDNLHRQIYKDPNILNLLNSNKTYLESQQDVNQLFDIIKMWETICILRSENNKQKIDTEYLEQFIENIQTIMRNIRCFNNAYKNTILKINPKSLAAYISRYKIYRENIDYKYASQQLSAEKLNEYISLIQQLMASITSSIKKTGKTEIINKINKFGTSNYLNTFFDKILNKLIIENKEERDTFMKYFKYYANNYCKEIYRKFGEKINLKYFCWKIEAYITPKNQRKYLNDSTWKKIWHPFTEEKKQENTSMEDIYYSKGAIYNGINFVRHNHSWVTSYLTLGAPILNILSCISIELISDWLLEFYNRQFITNDIKEMYYNMTIDKSLVPYISYVLSKMNSEIRTADYKQCFNYITKSNHYFDHTKSDHIGTIIQIYIAYISANITTNYDLNLLSKNFIELLDEKIINNENIFQYIFNDNLSSKFVYKPKNWEKFVENYRNDPKTRECTQKYFSKLLPMLNELVQFFYSSEFVQQYIKQCSQKEIIKQRIKTFEQSPNRNEQAILDFLKFFAIQYGIDLNDIYSLNEAKKVFFQKIRENKIINSREIKFLFINSIETMINLTKYQIKSQIENIKSVEEYKQKAENVKIAVNKGVTYLKKFIWTMKKPENEKQDNDDNIQSKEGNNKIIVRLKSAGVKIFDYFTGDNEYYTNFMKIFFYDKDTLKNIITRGDTYKDIIK